MEDRIALNSVEPRRVLVLDQLEAGVRSSGRTAQLLGLGASQVRQVRASYRARGFEALTHGNRGRRPVNAADAG
ncbi:MAG: helix-turn-helix domain-containing protein, partial [Candidatus Dormibacteria bacterium]